MSKQQSRPRTPTGLDPHGRAFWRNVTSRFELDPAELELLVATCRTIDTIDGLQTAVDSDGLLAAGSKGQPRLNPAVGELRNQRALLGRLLGQLQLPDEDGTTLLTPRQVRGRAAAQARWRAHKEALRARRGEGP
jgi:hypothetical protein